MQPIDPDSSIVAAMRLSGARFKAKGMPAESLVEVAAFEEILRTLAKFYWLDRHPHRERVPKAYDGEISLRLSVIGEGSKVPVLEHDASLRDDDLFGPTEIREDYARALDTVDAFIRYGLTNRGEIPADIRRVPTNMVKKLGKTMQRGDAIQIASNDRVDWDSAARYTPDARTNAIKSLDVESTRPATVDGRVVDFHVLSGKLIVRDPKHKNDISVPYFATGVAATIGSDQQLFRCRAQGDGEFNADGHLTKLINVKSIDVTDVTEDARATRAALTALGDLDEGWVDGESGKVIAPAVIERGLAVIDAMISLGNVTRSVFPTEEGGARFYWPDAENQLSVEVEPSGELYVHTADIDAGTFDEVRIPPDTTDLPGALDSWLSEVESSD